MKTQKGNNMTLWVLGNYDDLSRKAAEIIAAQIKEKPDSVIGFATGGTPIGTYKELIKMHKEDGLDFSKITTFNLDEYYPISRDNNQSYYYFMFENFFNHVNVDKSKINLPNGSTDNLEKEIIEYEEKIQKVGGIDLQILGIGSNGHIAFNEPAETFSTFTSKVSLTDETIKANARFFEKEEDVPKTAISMGIRSIMMAKKIILVANGKGKVDALRKTILENPTPLVPASVLQFHQNVTFVIDEEANDF